MVEFSNTLYARLPLHLVTCKNLTFTSMNGKGNYHARKIACRIIEELVSKSALNRFELVYYMNAFHRLEWLHYNVPSLKSFIMNGMQFNDVLIPHKIQPVTWMRNFGCAHCHFNQFEDDSSPQFLYIRKKYTHLKKLSIEFIGSYIDYEYEGHHPAQS